MKNEKVYPEWVQQQRTKGTTVKKVGNTYYLYKRTSKRVPGKKYPQPVDTYIGILTPDGIIERKKQQLATTSIKVKEYGFSKAVWDSVRRCLKWCENHIDFFRQHLGLKNGIASPATVSRILGNIDEEIFCLPRQDVLRRFILSQNLAG